MQQGFHDAQQLPTPPVLTGDDERAATCALASLGGIGPQSLALIRARFGNLASAVAAGGPEIAKTEELRSDGVAALTEARNLDVRGQRLVERTRALGARVLLCGEPGYPPLLAQAPGAPPVLYVMGDLPERRRAAVVGSRTTDRYGAERAEAISRALVLAGVEVVSGGAVGVDKCAHELALKAGARTVAVVGTGLDKCYPAVHGRLYDQIARKGAVITEYALGGGGQKGHFPRRNRIIAGLSEAVAFVRGTYKSGAISTCEAASRLGRPVFAAPGNVGDPLAEGPNLQLAQGHARVTLDGAEIVRALGLAAGTRPAPAAPSEVVAPEGTERVLNVLGPAPRHVDDVARDAGVSTADALSDLLRLELAGLCVALPGTYFQRR